MILCLFEDDQVAHLEPLTLTRAVYHLHLGVSTLAETTRYHFGNTETVQHCRTELRAVTAEEQPWPLELPEGADVLFVNGRLVLNQGPLLDRLKMAARPGEPPRLFVQGDELVAAWIPSARASLLDARAITRATFEGVPEERVEGARLIGRLWHLIRELATEIVSGYERLTRNVNVLEREGVRISPGATYEDLRAVPDDKVAEIVEGDLYASPRPGPRLSDASSGLVAALRGPFDRARGGPGGWRILAEPERIYTGPGVTIRPGAILNAENGPIYVGSDSTIFEGAVIRGPTYIGPRCEIRTGANIEGSSFGYYCKLGGEILNSVFHSLSSKPHAGFLGHAYIGRWCNLGAETNNSNLRNDYSFVKIYNSVIKGFEISDQNFLGVFMGDHAKCGITTMYNTGTVVGTFCNLFGAGFHAHYLPPFTWGGPNEGGYTDYRIDKALKVAEVVMARRGRVLTDAERELLTAIYEASRNEAPLA